jgi:RNA polymerase sigma factor (sigma-70 family)
MTNISQAILEHVDALNAYARKLTKDKEKARDLCQDTLFKALANGESFNRGSDVRPWLFTIMRNLFINRYRRGKLEKKLFSLRPLELVVYTDPSTHSFASAKIELKEMQTIIETMPPTLRIPINLYCQGYKYQEIAAMTATAVGTTKSRIHMARKILHNKRA